MVIRRWISRLAITFAGVTTGLWGVSYFWSLGIESRCEITKGMMILDDRPWSGHVWPVWNSTTGNAPTGFFVRLEEHSAAIPLWLPVLLLIALTVLVRCRLPRIIWNPCPSCGASVDYHRLPNCHVCSGAERRASIRRSLIRARNSRRRRVLFWICLVLSGICTTGLGICWIWRWFTLVDGPIGAVALAEGNLVTITFSRFGVSGIFEGVSSPGPRTPNSWGFPVSWVWVPRLNILPTPDITVVEFRLPIWIPFVLFVAGAAVLHRFSRAIGRAGTCSVCDYNLTGNVSGRCPECGCPAESRSDSKHA